MTWRSILVHVKAYKEWSEHIDVAMRLAKSFNARIRGLHTSRNAAILKQYLGAESQAALEAEAREMVLAGAAEQRFRNALTVNGVAGDWDVGEGAASELLPLAGRVHDLIVVEQTHEGFDESGWDVAETCAVSSGTPTLVVPFEGSFPSTGQRVLVAWNGSRQAAAALHGALPLIRRAQHVTALIGRGKESFSSITRYPKLDIAEYLRLHASDVSARTFEASEIEDGAKMLQVAKETNSDLLVMGAYGHSAWREFFLGGTTRYVLSHMTVPVLMAH